VGFDRGSGSLLVGVSLLSIGARSLRCERFTGFTRDDAVSSDSIAMLICGVDKKY
jgi:hypothetical protein